MFDLEQAIADWRQRANASGVKSPAVLDELESHLREEIALQTAAGSNDQAAFDAAVLKIGSLPALQGEFAKIDDERNQQLKRWSLMGVTCFYALFAGSVVIGKLGALSDLTPTQQFSGMGAVVLTCSLLMGGLVLARFFPVIASQRARMVIYLGAVVVAISLQQLFYHLVMTHFEFDPGQLAIAVLWAMTAFSLPATVIVGLEEAARLKGIPAASFA